MITLYDGPNEKPYDLDTVKKVFRGIGHISYATIQKENRNPIIWHYMWEGTSIFIYYETKGDKVEISLSGIDEDEVKGLISVINANISNFK